MSSGSAELMLKSAYGLVRSMITHLPRAARIDPAPHRRVFIVPWQLLRLRWVLLLLRPLLTLLEVAAEERLLP